jgi:hypothetical protein
VAEATLSAIDFEPLREAREIQAISRPSLSYWQDAWIRLKANTRALISLYIVAGLLAFTMIGPLLWQVDPAAQDVDQISQPPGAERSASVVVPYQPWDGSSLLTLSPGLRLAEAATNQSVRLMWDATPAANRYRIYRNIFPIGPEGALGLPLAENFGLAATTFEDRLDLVPRT